MQIHKFITYFKNGVIATKLSENIGCHIPEMTRHVGQRITHADLCNQLKQDGIVSENIISVGYAVVQNETVIILENTPVKEIKLEDIIKCSIKSQLKFEDPSQGLFNFAKEH